MRLPLYLRHALDHLSTPLDVIRVSRLASSLIVVLSLIADLRLAFMSSLASLHPFSAFCFFAGGRAVTRFYQAALFVGDERAAKAAMSEIEVFRFVLLCPTQPLLA